MPISPDVPAYVCYAVVVIVGLIVALSTVRKLLSDLEDRFAFAATWLLLLIYTLLPVALFWLLDYTSAIRDTALFAAIFVAIAYQQIFAGSVNDYAVPGPARAFWAPFQAWAKTIVDRITTKVQLHRQRFNDNTLAAIESDSDKQAALTQLLTTRGLLPGIQGDLNALPQDAESARIRVQWNALKNDVSAPFGDALVRSKIISRKQRWWYLERGRATIVSWAICSFLIALTLVGWWAAFRPSSNQLSLNPEAQRVKLWYYRWRLRKLNTSPQDLHRTEDFVERLAARAQLDAARAPRPPSAANAPDSAPVPDYLKPLDFVLGGVLHDFCSGAESPDQADHTLPAVYKIHTPALDSVIVPQLLDCLQTPNPDLRLRIKRVLAQIALSDFPQLPQPDARLIAWVPVKDEPLDQIDCYARGWKAWWLPKLGQIVTYSDACLKDFTTAMEQPVLAPAKP